MATMDDEPESLLACLLRSAVYFVFGALLGLFPGVILFAVTPDTDIAWRILTCVVAVFGGVFCVLGILTRGRIIVSLLRIFGIKIDPPFLC